MTPTRTALALALTAAALIVGAPAASAEESCGFADPAVPGGWVATDCFTTDPEAQAVPVEQPQPQLPEETEGRQIDCPDGQVGRQTGDMIICPAPAAPAPAAAPVVPVQVAIGDAGGDVLVTVDTAPAAAPTAPTAAAPTAVVAPYWAW